MPPKPQPLVYQTCVLSKSLLVFEILWQSWLWVLSACCKLGMSHMVESINKKSVWKFLGELTLLGWLHNAWSWMWWVLEEAASGWGASLAKGKELRSSRMIFRGGMVSACLRSAALWFGCSMFLSKAETFQGRDRDAVMSAASSNSVTVPYKRCLTRSDFCHYRELLSHRMLMCACSFRRATCEAKRSYSSYNWDTRCSRDHSALMAHRGHFLLCESHE